MSCGKENSGFHICNKTLQVHESEQFKNRDKYLKLLGAEEVSEAHILL